MNSERSQTMVRLIAVAVCAIALAWVERHQAPVAKPEPIVSTAKPEAAKP